MQVEAEAPVGAGPAARIGAGDPCAGAGTVPQREADALPAVRPGGRGAGHEVHRGRRVLGPGGVVPGQGHGQARAQQPVGCDARHVPAQQVGSQVAEVGPDPVREVAAVRAGQGTQVEIDVEACGGACRGPVAGMAAGGRSLDHGGRHGVLAYAEPEGEAGVPVRGPSEHQHSPCAVGTSDP